MVDQCGNCIIKGNLDGCLKTDCSHHETWYAKKMSDELNEAYALIGEAAERFCEISETGTIVEKRVMAGGSQGDMEDFLIEKGRMEAIDG